MKRFAVSIEICHIMSRVEADALAEEIRGRLNDIDGDVYICVSDYEKVRDSTGKGLVSSKLPIPIEQRVQVFP